MGFYMFCMQITHAEKNIAIANLCEVRDLNLRFKNLQKYERKSLVLSQQQFVEKKRCKQIFDTG